MKNIKNILLIAVLIISPVVFSAQKEAGGESGSLTGPPRPEQQEQGPEDTEFVKASASIEKKLEGSLAELSDLREQVAGEIVPLNQELNKLEAELVQVRLKYQEKSRLLDTRTLDLNNLQNQIKQRKQESTYLSNLLGEYIRNFETRLHIAELQKYSGALEEARLASENSNLSQEEVFEAQAKILSVSLERLFDALGGSTFAGTAVDSTGLVKKGTFVMVGPVAVFRSEDGQNVGTVEQQLGSLEPAIIPFADPADAAAAAELIVNAKGSFPLDPSLGNAHKIEATKESFIEHVQKGGVVMIPIFGLAGLALLVALLKYLQMAFIRTPSKRKVNKLLEAISRRDEAGAKKAASEMRGPVGKMLAIGVDHIKEPRDLIEEVMYEKLMSVRLSLQSFLPFVSITAASAPLLGLLGTVTGIINTFKLITVFGSGDVKSLSGGISEALITTKFGLIVAIPSLLLYAFLSKKAKGIIDKMEKAAVALLNQVGRTPFAGSELDPASLSNMQDAKLRESSAKSHKASIPSGQDLSGATMEDLIKREVCSVVNKDTVGDAIEKIRSKGIDEDTDTVFVVDEHDKYVGHVRIGQLLSRPEQTAVDVIADKQPLYVRLDCNPGQLHEMFNENGLGSMAVLDHEDRLVGCVCRNGKNKGNGDGK